jgi:hypothetical protein
MCFAGDRGDRCRCLYKCVIHFCLCLDMVVYVCVWICDTFCRCIDMDMPVYDDILTMYV